jgi:hypothetical protein
MVETRSEPKPVKREGSSTEKDREISGHVASFAAFLLQDARKLALRSRFQRAISALRASN